MTKVLITGSTGFIGSNIYEYLYPDNEIYLIDRKKLNLKKKLNIINYNSFNDLNKKLRKVKVDVVIHCATHYVKKHSYKDIFNLNNANILLGNILLENLSKMNVKKFINFSTVWEDYNGIKGNNHNLYSAYKKNFSNLVDYYKKIKPKIKFYEIMLSDTFGKNDKRNKIVNLLKKNYKNNIKTDILSKNIYLNLLNVEDIQYAIDLILNKKISPNKYILKNNQDFKILEIINTFNKINKKKIKIKWLSSKILKTKIYSYKKLNGWKPKYSNLIDIVNIIKN